MSPEVWKYLLVFIRISVFVTVCPVFFPTGSPRTLKAISSMAFTLVMAPLIGFAAPDSGLLAGKFTLMLREALLGLIMGSAIQMPFAALRAAGSLMDTQTGMSMAHMMDPSAGQSQTVMASFMGMISVLLFLCMDGHLWVLRGLATSFQTLPVGGAWPQMNGIGNWINMTGLILSTALQISAPITALLLLTEFSLGIISRILPQLNLLILGQPVRFAMGLGAAAIFMGFMETLSGKIFSQFMAKWSAILASL